MTHPNAPLRNPRAHAECPHCQAEGHVVVRMGAFAQATPCECLGTCPNCHGDGFVPTSTAFRAPMRRCTCQVVGWRLERFNAVGIPARHFNSTLASFNPTPQLMPVFSAINTYIRDFRADEINRGFVLNACRTRCEKLVG